MGELLIIQFQVTHLGPVDVPHRGMGHAEQPKDAYTLLPLFRQAAQQLPFIIYCPFLSEEAASPYLYLRDPKSFKSKLVPSEE